jgi:hypothetical protein
MTMTMTKKRTSKPQRTPHRTLYLRLDVELAEALRAYIDSIRPRSTTNAVMAHIVEQHLIEKGYWPPKAEEGE